MTMLPLAFLGVWSAGKTAATALADQCKHVPYCLQQSFCADFLSLSTSTVTATYTSSPETATVYVPVVQPVVTVTVTSTSSYTVTDTSTVYDGTTTYTTCVRTSHPPAEAGPTGFARNLLAAASPYPCPATTRLPSSKLSSACSCIATSPSVTETSTVTGPAKTTVTETPTVSAITSTYYTYSYTVIRTTTTVSAQGPLVTQYDLHADSTYVVGEDTYNIYDDYTFDIGGNPYSSVSCQYGLCDYQPADCPIPDCPNGLQDCLQICSKYYANCTAVDYDPIGLNSNRTCTFITDPPNYLSCGYISDTFPGRENNNGSTGVLVGFDGITT